MNTLERHILNNDGELLVIVIADRTHPPLLGADYVKTLDDTHVQYNIRGANALDYLMNSGDLSIRDKMNMITKGSVDVPFKYVLTDPQNGIPPQRARPSDSGFDLSIIAIRKKIGNMVMYGTGVAVQPPTGFYFDLVPRSSIIKKGYMLANSIGIIDQAYTGEIMVPLVKIDPEAPDLELPQKLVQLIPRKWYGLVPTPVDTLVNTSRADGGFGSTNGNPNGNPNGN